MVFFQSKHFRWKYWSDTISKWILYFQTLNIRRIDGEWNFIIFTCQHYKTQQCPVEFWFFFHRGKCASCCATSLKYVLWRTFHFPYLFTHSIPLLLLHESHSWIFMIVIIRATATISETVLRSCTSLWLIITKHNR